MTRSFNFYTISLLPYLFCFLSISNIVSAQKDGTETLGSFLGTPLFISQQMWEGRGGTSILTAKNGDVIAFHGRNDNIRISKDGGQKWSPEYSMNADFSAAA